MEVSLLYFHGKIWWVCLSADVGKVLIWYGAKVNENEQK